ncbi:hypothetical protein B0H19DRAFT_1255410 [Mycena capillaripes]|nr:hypothetical protein B0H19DRAFT_1255410 [Mycena capillaripes]
MSSILLTDSGCPYIRPQLAPTYLKPTNITKYGFHDPREILLGFPLNLEPIRDHHDDLLDPRRNSSWLRHDLALPYYYDTVQYIDAEGQWLPVPVVRIVYRRDRDLRKSEIIDYLCNKKIPSRYPPRLSGGVVNEPMNEDNWKRMVRRFCLKVNFHTGPYLCERSTGRTVQRHYLHFEDNLWMRVVVGHRDPASLAYGGPERLLSEMERKVGRFWYLDLNRRTAVACASMLLGPDFRLKFGYPGARDAGEELIDTFTFDDGEEEVYIDC